MSARPLTRWAFERARCQALKALAAQHLIAFFELALPQRQAPLYFVLASIEHRQVVRGLAQDPHCALDRLRPFLKQGPAVVDMLRNLLEHFALTLDYVPSLNSPVLQVGPLGRA